MDVVHAGHNPAINRNDCVIGHYAAYGRRAARFNFHHVHGAVDQQVEFSN